MWNFWREPTDIFVGNVDLQRLHIYFCGWKGWWIERATEAMGNSKAMTKWRQTLLQKCTRDWRLVKIERLAEESNNEKGLNFWYKRLIVRCMRRWIARTSYFKEIRLEAELALQRSGLHRFIEGVMQMKMWRIEQLAANKMLQARTRKRIRRLFRHWINWTDFEKTEREFKEERDGQRSLLMHVFYSWRMCVRATILTKLTYRELHHDRFIDDFKELVDVNIHNAEGNR